MNLIKDKHKRRAALTTVIVHVVLMFVFYSFGLTYMDPKTQDGIAIEFGYQSIGADAEFTHTQEIIDDETPPSEIKNLYVEADQAEVVNELLSQEVEESITIVEENTDQTQVNQEIVKKEEQPTASQELQEALSSLFQSNTTSLSGADDIQASQGEITGDIQGTDAEFDGGVGSLDGYELANRRAIRKPKPKYTCNKTGVVVIRVWVNTEGETYKAELDLKNTTDTSPCLVNEAKAAALQTTWLADANANPTQIGSIIYNFRTE
jgi:outer membrane biosynthesis protein TonB